MATEEAQLAAQDHAQRQAHLKQQCISTGGGPAAGGGGGGTRKTAVLKERSIFRNESDVVPAAFRAGPKRRIFW